MSSYLEASADFFVIFASLTNTEGLSKTKSSVGIFSLGFSAAQTDSLWVTVLLRNNN